MSPKGWMHPVSPFHPGEQAVQRRVGLRDRVECAGRQGIRDHLLEQHRIFFAQLPFVVLGAIDTQGLPWATLLVGDPGFTQSPDPWTLRIQVELLPDDPLCNALPAGAEVGLLGIELQTRRRNRMNGQIAWRDKREMLVAVERSFGNCPKYIQKRDFQRVTLPTQLPAPEQGNRLDDEAVLQISSADTFFIATHVPASRDEPVNQYGADVSHRGGAPGFVRIDDAKTLLWPDFTGNSHFNTLGNLQIRPQAGLLFPDFVTGDLLYLTGEAEVIWDGKAVAAFAGAERLVRFHIKKMLRLRERFALRWTLQEVSPSLHGMDAWEKPVERSQD